MMLEIPVSVLNKHHWIANTVGKNTLPTAYKTGYTFHKKYTYM